MCVSSIWCHYSTYYTLRTTIQAHDMYADTCYTNTQTPLLIDIKTS